MKTAAVSIVVGASCLGLGFAAGYFFATRKLEDEMAETYTKEIHDFVNQWKAEHEGFEAATKGNLKKAGGENPEKLVENEKKPSDVESKLKEHAKKIEEYHDYSDQYRPRTSKKKVEKPDLEALKAQLDAEDEVKIGPDGDILEEEEGFEEPAPVDRGYIEVVSMKMADLIHPDYDRITLEWYDGNGVLVDDGGDAVSQDEEKVLVGDEALAMFGELDPENPDLVFVVNHRLRTIFEVVKVDEDFE